MFQELAEYMGLQKLNERLKDPYVIWPIMWLSCDLDYVTDS